MTYCHDQSTIAAHAVDTIKVFRILDGDKLSLKGLLVGDHSNLGDFLKFEQVGNKLTLQLDHNGSTLTSTLTNSEFHTTPTIVFDNYSSTQQLATDLSVAVNSSFAELISKMIAAGKLIID